MSDRDHLGARDVVVVDDDELTLELVKRLLRGTGFSVRCFSDPDDALAYLEVQPAKVLLVDQRMPRQCGLEFLKRLAKQKRFAASRTFLCSATKLPDSVSAAARDLGANTVTKDIYQSTAKLMALLLGE